jgi:hypothetical protein
MKKFIISESEKQRILEMHQNATSRQYLNEAATPFPGVSEAATYFQGLYIKNQLKTGSSYQSTYTKFVITATQDQINDLSQERMLVAVYGLVKRSGLWDVCESNEILNGTFSPMKSGTGTPIVSVNPQNWNSVGGYILLTTERQTATEGYKLGQNAATFGGDSKFVNAVKSTPRYKVDLASDSQNYLNAIKKNPARANDAIAKQIYTTTQPVTKP